jgi:magnesium transporter
MSETAPQTKSRLQAVRAAIESGRLRPIRRMLLSLQPAEIALLLDSLPPAERELLWEAVHPDDEGEVLLHVAEEVRAGLIRGMDDEELVAAAGELEVDDLADLIGDLPETVTQRVLRSLDELDRGRLQRVLTYPQDTAGGLMNTDAVTVRPEVTLEVVRRYLRMHGNVPDKTDCLFVVNRYGKYLGTLFVTRLLTNEDDLTVSEVMETEPVGISAEQPAAEVARLFANRDLVSAPVVDTEGRLVGRITVDDVVDVISEQAEHSIMSMAGLNEEDDIFAPVAASARRRALWLGINLGTAFLAAWVVGLFESTIERVVALAVLMPIVASMGGIAGTQTLTLIVRGLALGQIEWSNARPILVKEIAVGVLNGLAWAVVVAAIALLWFHDWRIGIIIAVAMTTNLLAAALSGVGIPLLMKRLGIDPALAGGVVLTTVTDCVGFMTLLGLGALFLK